MSDQLQLEYTPPSKPRSASGFPQPLENFLGRELAVLTRHFLNRYVNSDLTGPDGEITLTAGNVMAFLAAPGLVYTLGLVPKYSWMAWHMGPHGSWSLPGNPAYLPGTLPDKFLYVTLTIVVIGFLTVLRWDTLFPDLFDFMALTPLPLSARRVFAAKCMSLALVVSILALDLNVVTSVGYPWVVLWKSYSFLEMLRFIVSHAIAVFSASAFVFLLLLAIQGTLLSLLGHRLFQRLSPWVQFAALLWLGNQFLMIADLHALLERVRQGSSISWFFPALWYLGLYEKLLGRADPVFPPLAARAVKALGYTAVIACVSYVIGYARHLHSSLESKEDSDRPPGWTMLLWTAAANRWLLRDPRERASFHFVVQTVIRNPMHRLFLSAYIGVGTAVIVEGLATLLIGTERHSSRDIAVALYSLPLTLSFFLLSGLRVIFTVPAELRANWTFQLAEDESRALLLSGTRKAVLSMGIVPLFLATFGVFTWFWGWGAAAVQALFGASLAWMLMEALFWNFSKIPFTCTYQPGKLNLPLAGLLYLAAFAVYAYAMASFDYWLLEQSWRMAVYLALAAVALVVWFVCRERYLQAGLKLLFDDQPEPEVRTLGIG
jgi:hypothetical protein